MVISTRPKDETTHKESLIAILSAVTNGQVGGEGSAHFAGSSMPEVITTTGLVLKEAAYEVASARTAVALYAAEVKTLNKMFDDATEVIERFLDVSFDDALDHATSDLMDMFCSTGAADVNSSGEIFWDDRVTMAKADIKPLLQEAIMRWVELKIKA